MNFSQLDQIFETKYYWQIDSLYNRMKQHYPHDAPLRYCIAFSSMRRYAGGITQCEALMDDLLWISVASKMFLENDLSQYWWRHGKPIFPVIASNNRKEVECLRIDGRDGMTYYLSSKKKSFHHNHSNPVDVIDTILRNVLMSFSNVSAVSNRMQQFHGKCNLVTISMNTWNNEFPYTLAVAFTKIYFWLKRRIHSIKLHKITFHKLIEQSSNFSHQVSEA